jgi:hypothetical protein
MNLLLSIATIAGLFAPDMPLTARLIPGPAPQVELRNTGTQPVNAWAFAVSSPNDRGGIHREFHTADVYLSEVTSGLQGAAPHLNRIMPGETRTVPIDAVPAGASVQVTAIVLEDNTAIGDEQTIASFFEKRVVERDQLKRVVDVFNAVLPTMRGAAALDELQKRLSSSTADADSVPHRSAREAVSAWIQRARTASSDEIDSSVRTYAAFVAKQYDVAARHGTRKG